MIKTLIIDDEEHARNRLSYLLNDQPDLDVIGVCENGLEAIKTIENVLPELVFLDIEMPEINGFDVIANLEMERLPIIIFVTAYSEYAVKAFEVNALDYIHKPFDKERLGMAIERAREQIKNYNEAEVRKRLEALLEAGKQEKQQLERFILKAAGNIYIVKPEDVLWIEAAGNYISVVTETKKFLQRSTLSAIKERLAPDQFFQVHRSTIVNIEYVHCIEEGTYGDFVIVMKNEAKVKMSRNYKELLNSF